MPSDCAGLPPSADLAASAFGPLPCMQVLSIEGGNLVEGLLKLISAGESPYARIECGDASFQGYEVYLTIAPVHSCAAHSCRGPANELFHCPALPSVNHSQLFHLSKLHSMFYHAGT